MSIAVVTDSTAYLPDGLADRHAIRSVPLHVSVDGVGTFAEPGFGSDELATAFERKQRVTTSGASAADLARVYREVLDEGADGVVSLHLSRRLSSTWDAARLAANEVDPERIRVIDSRSAAMGLGFAALAASVSAAEGAELAGVERRATAAAEETTTLFSVQTLEYLRRGGRIGTAAALLGTALAIKPLLHVHQGRIDVLDKVRTTARAMTRLVDLAGEAAGRSSVSIAVHHLAAPERAEAIADRVRSTVVECEDCVVSEVGPVIGAHIGPGAVGVVLLPGGWRSPAK
ncbi:DegV family protein [Parasphingorhabdus pacifica]